MEKVTGQQFANNAIWKFFEMIVQKFVGLIISTVLARMLLPEAYGIVALTTVFITFSDIFILNGFNVALIRKEQTTENDYATVMMMSLLFALVLYVIFFVYAPVLAVFYNSPELVKVLRTITTILFFRAVSTVIRAKGTRELKFREMSVVTVTGNISAGLIGLILAYRGYGVWALVGQQVSAAVFDLILLSAVFHWRFRLCFNRTTIREMFSFTMGVVGSSFMDFLGNNANSLVVGRAYSPTELGYMNRGNMYPEVIGLNTFNTISSVLLPTLASRQGDRREMKIVVRRVVSITGYILFPMMIGLIGISRNFIVVLLTDKWLPCLGIMICSCINYLVNPIRSIGYSIFYALGESKTTLKIEVIRMIMMLINLFLIIIFLNRSIYDLAIINLLIAFLILFITQWYVKKSVNYSYKELFTDIFPAALLSLPMLIVTVVAGGIVKDHFLALLLQIVLGAGVYLCGSILTKNANLKILYRYAAERITKL